VVTLERSVSARTLRTTAAFLVAAGFVLALLVAGVVLREIVAPPAQTWSPWTSGAIIVTALLALVLWACGAVLSHRVRRERRDSVRTFLTHDEAERVSGALREAEASTSGELVVHLADRSHGAPTAEARKAFERIGMTRTRDRNGVLFFVSIRDHKLAVIGDEGIHASVPPEFWANVVKHVEARFGAGQYADGLVEGIRMAAVELAKRFPRRADDVNELPDAVSRGNGGGSDDS
jgi:uncharacterized membrane protein